MRTILLFVVIALASSSFLPKLGQVPSRQNIIDFIIGSLVSLKVTEDIPDGFPCVNTISSLQSDTKTAIALIKNGSVITGLELFENAVNQTLSSCGAASDEGQADFQAFLQKIKDANFLFLALGRIKDNFGTLWDDWSKGVSDLNNESYFSAGVDFGSIAHLILSGPDSSLSTVLIEEINKLGAVNWPFTDCSSGSALEPTGLTLDATPSKGVAEGVNVVGTANAAVTLKQVQIVTQLNGTPLNTQYDANTNSYNPGDDLNYRFAITIPSFAPSGAYSVTLTFQGDDGSTAACVNVAFNL